MEGQKERKGKGLTARLAMETRRWKVETITHRKTGLLIAMSNDLPGLYVHGRNEDELNDRVPQAIKALLEAAGETDVMIVRCEDEELSPNFKANVAHYALNNCYA